jgi:hypothetical protein
VRQLRHGGCSIPGTTFTSSGSILTASIVSGGVGAAPTRERTTGSAGQRHSGQVQDAVGGHEAMEGGHSAAGDDERSYHCRRRGCCCTHSSV